MNENTYTHKDLAGLLGVSETTVKSYRRKFPGCIPVSSKGKPIRFTERALPVATRIRDLFDTGMGVDDVRARLAAEFDWISPESPMPLEPGSRAAKGDVTPEISLGVSNMAKSLVSMTQQQKAILARIQGLEALLEDMGVSTGGNPEELAAAKEQRAAATREREAQLENRLDRLDGNTKALSETVKDLAGQLSRFLGQREKAAESWPQQSAAALAAAAELAAQTAGVQQAQAVENGSGSSQESGGATVIPLRPGAGRTGQPQARPATLAESAAAEPQRAFFTLPLVVRTEEGRYISAGGKSRGRFSLNDLKAMLIYGFTPPNHFTLRWEQHGQGWWLFLEQEQGERAVHLMLMELPTQKGGSVAEILQVRHNKENVHPAEICAIIDSFGA